MRLNWFRGRGSRIAFARDANDWPTTAEVAEVTSRVWCCPLHERIDRILRDAAVPDTPAGIEGPRGPLDARRVDAVRRSIKVRPGTDREYYRVDLRRGRPI